MDELKEKNRQKEIEIRVADIEKYFKSESVPEYPIRLDEGATIVNMKKFLGSHLKTVRSCVKRIVVMPYLERLELLRTILETNHE